MPKLPAKATVSPCPYSDARARVVTAAEIAAFNAGQASAYQRAQAAAAAQAAVAAAAAKPSVWSVRWADQSEDANKGKSKGRLADAKAKAADAGAKGADAKGKGKGKAPRWRQGPA